MADSCISGRMDNKYKDEDITVRQAKKEDMAVVAKMIQELADFEKMSDGPKMTIEDLQHDGFGSNPPAFQCKIAELNSNAGIPNQEAIVGYALYFPTYSTWTGRSLMLEDLYVKPEVRRKGVGHRLFNAVAKEASNTGCRRLDFHVLEWNDARSFYEGRGAVNLTSNEKWCYYRLDGDALDKVSNGDKTDNPPAEQLN